MATASHAEGRQLDPGQVYNSVAKRGRHPPTNASVGNIFEGLPEPPGPAKLQKRTPKRGARTRRNLFLVVELVSN